MIASFKCLILMWYWKQSSETGAVRVAVTHSSWCPWYGCVRFGAEERSSHIAVCHSIIFLNSHWGDCLFAFMFVFARTSNEEWAALLLLKTDAWFELDACRSVLCRARLNSKVWYLNVPSSDSVDRHSTDTAQDLSYLFRILKSLSSVLQTYITPSRSYFNEFMFLASVGVRLHSKGR